MEQIYLAVAGVYKIAFTAMLLRLIHRTLRTTLRPEDPRSNERVFSINRVAGSNMARAVLLRRMGHGDIAVYGF